MENVRKFLVFYEFDTPFYSVMNTCELYYICTVYDILNGYDCICAHVKCWFGGHHLNANQSHKPYKRTHTLYPEKVYTHNLYQYIHWMFHLLLCLAVFFTNGEKKSCTPCCLHNQVVTWKTQCTYLFNFLLIPLRLINNKLLLFSGQLT